MTAPVLHTPRLVLRPFELTDTCWVYEACRWAFGRLRLKIIEWRAEVGNLASRRVAERVGFTVEATLRRRLFHRGERVDTWVGSLLPTEL
jgi:RimJ/RimL family protein N-acetyltransferase